MSEDNQSQEIATMQICECKVFTDNKMKNSVLLPNVTPAEVIVLRHVHGEHAVQEPVLKGKVERTPIEEKLRMQEKYDRPKKETVDKVFPGHDPRMPTTFEAAGIEVVLAPHTPRPKGQITTLKGGKPDQPSKQEVENIQKSKSTVENISKELASQSSQPVGAGASSGEEDSE